MLAGIGRFVRFHWAMTFDRVNTASLFESRGGTFFTAGQPLDFPIPCPAAYFAGKVQARPSQERFDLKQ